jgi:putative Mg2+ transporter-C (MgtC) family protein
MDLVFRIGASVLAGVIVGIERESHGRAAGLRTTILVCVAACLAMLISSSLFVQVQGAMNIPDPARLAAAVLSGMGFLGAGSIIRNGNRVQGITTAATLWFVTMIGLAFGSGLFVVGGVGLGVAVVILFFLPVIERRVKNDWYAIVTVQLALDGLEEDQIRRVIEAEGVKVKKMDIDYDLSQRLKTLRFELKFKKAGLTALAGRVVKRLSALEGINHVSWS